ncbi:sodium-coupled monocarboxylate transporter 2-like isoform X1 [Amblyomma americanum]
MHVLEYVLFGVLVAANFSLGLYFSFRNSSAESGSDATAREVFLGSRSLRMLPLAASTVASLFSSTGLIALPAHYYAYGWHLFWGGLTPLLLFPFATRLFVPVVYKLGVTSVFEYIRLRFNASISLTACAVYIFFTQTIGAISIFAASLTLVTVFHAPLIWCNVAIGLSGTLYTALGGLRGVVWTDCMQFLVILATPTTLIITILINSLSANSTISPIKDLNVKKYIADFSLDLTRDENAWTCFFGLFAPVILRLCLDQVVAQRLLASRTMKEAQRIAITSSVLLAFVYCLLILMGVSLTIWYRGCDPVLSGAISSTDQILPYYVNTQLVHVPGFVGLFLAGVVCAATSTTSSNINSQAAVLYVDVIAPRWKQAHKHVRWITRGSAFGLGVTMTIYSMLCMYMGSLGRIFLMIYSCLASPHVGLCILALLFPFVHSKGAGVATIITVAYQLWHLKYTIHKGANPVRMPVSLDYCPENFSMSIAASVPTVPSPSGGFKSDQPFYLFEMSYYWSSFFGIFATVIIGVLVSALTGEMRREEAQPELCSDVLVKIWRKSRPPLQMQKNENIKTTGFIEKKTSTAEDRHLLTNNGEPDA